MKIPFVSYLHKSKEDAIWAVEEVCEKHGIKLSEKAEENAVYWGYEFEIQCVLDTDTGHVEVVGFEGHPIDKSKKLELKK